MVSERGGADLESTVAAAVFWAAFREGKRREKQQTRAKGGGGGGGGTASVRHALRLLYPVDRSPRHKSAASFGHC